MNLCDSCHKDFGSVSAFDAHRVGKHAYTYSEGVHMDPVREDGRRCLDTEELTEMGWKCDNNNRWRTKAMDVEFDD